MKKTKFRLLSAFLAFMLALTLIPLEVIALNVEDAGIVESELVTHDTDLKDFAMPTNEKHAYDPFARLESEEATKAYRESVQYVAGSIVYKVTETRGWFGGYDGKADEGALADLGIDLDSAEEISRVKTDDGFFTDTYEVVYEAKLEGDIWEAIDALAEEEGVVAAQPNYLYEDTAIDLPTIAKNPDKDKQWHHGPDHLDCDKHWQHMYEDDITPGEGTIVAVIDTGVDYTHPDLAANMWVNTAELNGTAGVDDDGNGYIDDIYGANTVGAKYYHSGDPMDDHGHGTHVAGIVAMTANNGEGGVGIAYGTKIMAIKAGQATGIFADTDIAEAIDYAVAMGADVINMSFGGAGKSFLVEEALSNAFGSCVLVAAAGNDGAPTADAPGVFIPSYDAYPAGYTYVLGVMASDQNGELAGFSNWDYYNNGGSAEYELTAPGVDIYSTLPGGQYAYWDGTSMAAPVVSAAAAMLRSKYSDRELYSSRFIMGQLASATTSSLSFVDKTGESHTYASLNIDDSLNRLPKPNLTVKNIYLFDDPEIDPANDGDGVVDAGETIEMGIVLRNQWGMAMDVQVSVDAISVGGVANPNIEWLTDSIQMENVGTFNEQNNSFVFTEEGILTGTENPIRFKVKSDCINDAHIGFNIKVTAKNALDEEDTADYTSGSEFYFFVQRGRVIAGTINEDMTWTKDDYWIVENTIYIPEGVTVTVEPGTQIQFWGSDASTPYAQQTMAYIEVEGAFIVNGTEEEPVDMFPSIAFYGYGVDIRGHNGGSGLANFDYETVGNTELNYANILNPRLYINKGDHLYVVQDLYYINYRVLSSGKVGDTSSTAIMNIQNLSNSVLNNLFASFQGNYENVLFNSCGGSTVQSSGFDRIASFINCTFNGKNSFTGRGYTIYDYVRYRFPRIEYSDIYTYGDSKYILIDPQDYLLFSNLKEKEQGELEKYSFLKYNFANALASNRGGYLASINTVEEREFLRIQLSYGDGAYTGGYNARYSGETVYPDGTRIDRVESGCYEAIYSSYDNYYEEFGDSSGFFLEYPSTVSDEDILAQFTVEEFVKALEQCQEYATFGDVSGFRNNAMLNSYYETDTDYWNKLVTTHDRESFSIAKNNYWGTTNEQLINATVVDGDTYASLMDIVTDPILTLESPELETIYPFVTEIYLTDTEGHRVSEVSYGQELTVHVKFNRDMDVSVQPMVSYGPAEPYTDYVLNGDFVSAREWCADFKALGVIDAGMEYFRVKDAVAADDAWLRTGTDTARFAFEVSRTGAQAMVLQGVGGVNKVELSWMQDDYDTLAGFNIYRSTTGAEGSFTKLNTRLIPGTIREYVDTAVEPGKEYFYYFTVMGTDLVESTPSNTVSATPLDNIKPTLEHSRVTDANVGEMIPFTVVSTDNIGVESVKLFYRTTGVESFKEVAMTLTEGNSYYAMIPAKDVTAAGVEYYIQVSDGTNVISNGSAIFPNVIAVDNKIVMHAVSPIKVDVSSVAEGVTAVVSGANFSESMTVTVGGKAVEYTYVSENQFSFTVPEGNIGRCDIKIVDGDRRAQMTNAITYVDASSTLQVDAVGEIKAREQVKLPITLTTKGDILGLDIQLSVERNLYDSITFEKSEACSMAIASCTSNYSGVVKISVASTTPLPIGEPIGYLVLTPKNVTEHTSTSVSVISANANAVAIENLVDCNMVILPNFTISGKITYYSSGEALEGVCVSLSNGMVAYTDENGCYTFTGVTTNRVVVTPHMSGKVNNAISAQDTSLVLQAITDDETSLDEMQYLAADVDGDGTLSALDAAYILQKSVGLIEGDFPGTAAEWIFDNGALVLNLTSDMTDVDFTAALLGDVTGDWCSTPQEELE